MSKFDIKDFLQENKLTEVSRLNEEFIELFKMDRDFERAVETIAKTYTEWKNGPAWGEQGGPSRSEEEAAKLEIFRYIGKKIDKG